MLIKYKSMLYSSLNVALVFNFRDVILGLTGSWLLSQCARKRVLQRKTATFCCRSYFSSLLLGFAMSMNVIGVLETVCWSFAVHNWIQARICQQVYRLGLCVLRSPKMMLFSVIYIESWLYSVRFKIYQSFPLCFVLVVRDITKLHILKSFTHGLTHDKFVRQLTRSKNTTSSILILFHFPPHLHIYDPVCVVDEFYQNYFYV